MQDDRDFLMRRAVRRSADAGPLAALADLLEHCIELLERILDALRAARHQLKSTDTQLAFLLGDRWWDRVFEARRVIEGDDCV